MTELRLEKLTIPASDFHGVSSLPSVAARTWNGPTRRVFELDEDDGLFIGYGSVKYAFPYRAQDNYDRVLCKKKVPTVVLENEYLRATFLPGYGGKLRSLYDKEAGRELLFTNSVLRPSNLGIRNAWMSGGVEWNCGYTGHNPFTCDLVHTARTELEDGTPVLRFYQYERIRRVVYQMDFFLPEGSRFLYGRMRIVNPHFEVVPMYWWSNIAVTDDPGSRVIVPADSAYTTRDGHVIKLPTPVFNGIDETYPENNVISIDYFWNIPDRSRKFIAVAGKDGYGLVQTSTGRLKGRKLFVWGNSAGGDRWKNFLSADGESGSYCEIQAGLAKSQYESLPMPPNTAWEWVEAYGALKQDPSAAHGDWSGAVTGAEERLEAALPERDLEELLLSTKKMATSPAGEVLFRADGWGALEQKRRREAGEPALCPHLDFGRTGAEQKPWVSLMEKGTTGGQDPTVPPVSYQRGPEWVALMRQAAENADKDNWFTLLQLGLNALSEEQYADARMYLKRSLAAARSPWALYALSVTCRDQGSHAEEVRYMTEALAAAPGDISLAKAALRCLYENGRYRKLKTVFTTLPEEVRAHPRCRVYYALALVNTGDIAGAEEILYENGGLVVPDLREGETITLELWYRVEEEKAAAAGKAFDRASAVPPRFVDFRMTAKKDWLYG